MWTGNELIEFQVLDVLELLDVFFKFNFVGILRLEDLKVANALRNGLRLLDTHKLVRRLGAPVHIPLAAFGFQSLILEWLLLLLVDLLFPF